jgi:hypothetical protein
MKKAVSKAACFILLYCLACSSILKMEARFLFETSIDFQRTTRCYIPEDRCFIQFVRIFRLKKKSAYIFVNNCKPIICSACAMLFWKNKQSSINFCKMFAQYDELFRAELHVIPGNSLTIHGKYKLEPGFAMVV